LATPKLVDCIPDVNLEVVVGIVIVIRVERTDKNLEEVSKVHVIMRANVEDKRWHALLPSYFQGE